LLAYVSQGDLRKRSASPSEDRVPETQQSHDSKPAQAASVEGDDEERGTPIDQGADEGDALAVG
jgi:hypothetical protein